MLHSIPKTVSTKRTNPSQICPTSSAHSRRPHHRCRLRTRDDGTRNQRGARNADTEHRPPNAESRGLLRRIEWETEKKRGEWAKKRTRRWITRASVSIIDGVRKKKFLDAFRARTRWFTQDDWAKWTSTCDAHYDFRVMGKVKAT